MRREGEGTGPRPAWQCGGVESHQDSSSLAGRPSRQGALRSEREAGISTVVNLGPALISVTFEVVSRHRLRI